MLSFFRNRMKDITLVIIWFIVITFVLSLLGSGALLVFSNPPPSRRNPQAAPTTPTKEPEKNPLLESRKEFAKLEFRGRQEVITEGDVEKRLQRIAITQGRAIDDQTKQFFRPAILDRLIEEKLIEIEADRQSIDVAKQVDEQLAKLFEGRGKDEYLKAIGQTEEEMRNILTREFRSQTLIHRIREGVTVSEEDLEGYYKQHKDEFKPEGAEAPKPFEQVRGEVLAKFREQYAEADYKDYYEKHKARWQMPPKVHLLHFSVDPESAAIQAATTPTDTELLEYYQEHPEDYLEPIKVDLAHIFVDPKHPDIQAAATPTEEDITKYYEANAEEFLQEDEFLISQILVGGIDGEKKAEAALDRLRAGDAFPQVASEASDDEATRGANGDMGWMTPSELPQAIGNLLSALDVGRISDPIRTPQGYHIVWMRQRRTGRTLPLDEVREGIVKNLKVDRSFELAEAKAQELFDRVAKGSDFHAVAKEASHAASKVSGGKVGVLSFGENTPSSMLEEVGTGGYLDFKVQEAVDGTEVGQVQGPVRSFRGFHVLKVLDKPERDPRPFEDVKESVRHAVRQAKVDVLVQEALDKARNSSDEAAFRAAIQDASTSVDVTVNQGDWGMITLDTSTQPDLPEEVRGEVLSWMGLSRRILEGVEGVPAGKVTDVVKLGGKHHVFFVLERAPVESQPYEKVKDEIVAALKPSASPEELKEYFEQNRSTYEARNVSADEVFHALFQVKAVAKGYLDQILAGTTSFEDVVQKPENMDRATASKGGRIPGQIQLPTIQAAVDATEEGNVHGKVVESPYGFHILKVGKRAETKEITLETVQDEVKSKVLEKKKDQVEKAYLQELKNQAEIEKIWKPKSSPFDFLQGLQGDE